MCSECRDKTPFKWCIMDDDLQPLRSDECLEQNNNNDDSEGAVGGSVENVDPQPESEHDEIVWSEEEFDRDPHRAYFYDAYRSEAGSPELDDSTENAGATTPERKPLALMDDWDLWDYMDEETLKQRLKYHPELLEQITRKRKRKAGLEESDDDDLCAVMERHAKVTKFNEHTKVY
ncbi:AAEL011295-PA [Aedes aegypti]|uniref:AAEL011295-PA n=1 Tax=Aedes aegypti TaxID=7159 RepID=Q16QG4_AEDAE|nr:AAEL011295-PA [Aedes aegypti]